MYGQISKVFRKIGKKVNPVYIGLLVGAAFVGLLVHYVTSYCAKNEENRKECYKKYGIRTGGFDDYR